MAISLAAQVLTISLAVLQRQLVHNHVASRSKWNPSYDYIVIGAGTSGCAVASRLSEDGRSSVLLLEAGGPNTVIADMPGNSAIDDVPENDWGYRTVAQPRAAGIIPDREINYNLGRIMGGSSTINLMVYNRGNRRDYDRWASEYSLPDWSYESMLPYFRRSERMFNQSDFPTTSGYHGTRGPVAISLPADIDPIHYHLVEAWNRMGVPTVDINGPEQVGVAIAQQTVDPRTWLRSSSVQAYIYPAINRTNLHILAHAHATRVLISPYFKHAYGVEFLHDDQLHQVLAHREVIVTAGTIGTSRILMLSGIGPRDDLEDLEIEVVADLPVGRHFQDHFMTLLPFLVKNESDVRSQTFQESRINVGNLYNYYVHNTGPLTSYPVSLSYYSTPGNDDPEWPNTVSANLVVQLDDSIYRLFQERSNRLAWNEYITPLVNNNRLLLIACGVYRIRTRGTVRLRSTDPLAEPLIDPNCLADQADAEAAIDIVERVLEFGDSEYFRQFATFYDKLVPGCEQFICPGTTNGKCRSYLKCLTNIFGWTSWHPGCSARMGGSPEYSVVDASLKVHGIRNLRVADGSVMPRLVNGNPNAAIFAIAEKAADLILSDNR